MTSKIKDDIRISQMANGFVVEPDTVFSKSDCYVFNSFESMVEWLRQYYIGDESNDNRPIFRSDVTYTDYQTGKSEEKSFILGSADPE